jgi:polysaccharide biosynthesis protein PslH
MKILIAAGHVPSPSVRHAAAKTSYHLCRYLAERHELHLLAFATREGLVGFLEQDMVIFRSWRTIPVKNSDRLWGALTAPRLPLAIAARNSHTYRQELHSLLAGQSFDVVLLDHTAMFQYSPETPKSIIVVGNAHDIVTQNWSRRVTMARNPLAGKLLRGEASRMRSWEQNAFATLDVVLVPSEKDKKLLLEMQPKATVLVIDPWVSTGPNTDRSDPEPGALLYWGAMNRAENIDAARWAATEILPRIRKAVPHAKLYIAGNHGEVLAREFTERTDIRITGFVDDVQSLMARMSVALLPLRQGAGIKVKILECMSAGLPVVTTPVGEEGVGGTNRVHYLVAETAEQLAAHIIRLLQDPDEARHMGERAAEFMRQRQNFAGRMAEVERFVEEHVRRARS